MWGEGGIFFIFNTLVLGKHGIDTIIVGKYFLKFPPHWYIKLLKSIDMFFIATTIIFIGERIASATYKEALKYRKSYSNKAMFSIEFDKTLASMVVITIAISFLTLVLDDGLLNKSLDIFYIGGGMALIIIAIGAWTYLDYKANSDIK